MQVMGIKFEFDAVKYVFASMACIVSCLPSVLIVAGADLPGVSLSSSSPTHTLNDVRDVDACADVYASTNLWLAELFVTRRPSDIFDALRSYQSLS